MALVSLVTVVFVSIVRSCKCQLYCYLVINIAIAFKRGDGVEIEHCNGKGNSFDGCLTMQNLKRSCLFNLDMQSSLKIIE